MAVLLAGGACSVGGLAAWRCAAYPHHPPPHPTSPSPPHPPGRPGTDSRVQLVEEGDQEQEAIAGQLPQDISWGPLVFEARRFVELRKKTFSGKAGRSTLLGFALPWEVLHCLLACCPGCPFGPPALSVETDELLHCPPLLRAPPSTCCLQSSFGPRRRWAWVCFTP